MGKGRRCIVSCWGKQRDGDYCGNLDVVKLDIRGVWWRRGFV